MSSAILFIVPLLCALLLVKGYKFVFAMWPLVETTTSGWHKPSVAEASAEIIASPFVRLCVLLAAVWLAFRFLSRRYSPWLVGAVLIGGTVLAKGATAVVTGDLSSIWHSYTAASGIRQAQFLSNIFRSDLKFAVGYWIFCGCVIAAAGRRWRRQAYGVLTVSSAIMLIVLGLEFAHYLKTGVTGNGELLFYFVRNAASLWFIVQSEVDLESTSALVAPVLIAGVVVALMTMVRRRRRERETGTAHPVATTSSHAVPLVGGLMLAVILIPDRTQQLHLRLTGNTLTSVGRDILSKPRRAAALAQAASTLARYGTAGASLRPVGVVHRLNLIVVMMESVRASATTVYDSTLATTPFLDSLAKHSLVAEQLHAVIPRTSAAWVSVLQGVYPGTNPVLMAWANSEEKHRRMTSLPRLLKPLGYRSAFFVGTDLAYENEDKLLANMGFDRVSGLKDYDPKTHKKINYFGLEDTVLIGPVLAWADSALVDKAPFVAVVMTNVSHHPYQTPSGWRSRDFVDSGDAQLTRYLNSVAYTDQFIKELMQRFDARGLLDSSIVIILGDHGEAFGEHAERLHGYSLYQESLHVPLLIYAPALIHSGRRIGGVRQQIDILPTVTALLGYQVVGAKLPGMSLLDAAPSDREIYFGSMLEQVNLGLRRGSQKFLVSFGRSPTEVYDLDTDPGERHDIAARIDRREMHAMERRLWSWQAEVLAALH